MGPFRNNSKFCLNPALIPDSGNLDDFSELEEPGPTTACLGIFKGGQNNGGIYHCQGQCDGLR
jgi:hypothetical protein